MTRLPKIARGILLALPVMLAASAVGAAPPGQDPDWPCAQLLVPKLTAGTYWTGPAPPTGADWRADPAIAALVAEVTRRDIAARDGEAKLTAFADSLAPEQRRTVLSELFAGLVDAINEQRHGVIVRLKELGRRQRSMAELVDKVTDELQSVPADASGKDAERRSEIEQRRGFLIRGFEQTQRTVQYACQVPTELEGRLGGYARALQAKL